MTGTGHVASADCEECRDGAIAQPVNTVSSLAFCVAGISLVRRHRGNRVESALAWSAVAAGLGSAAYHGPGTRAGQILHDASLITMLGALVAADVERTTARRVPAAVVGVLPVVATAAAASPWSLATQVTAGAAATAAEVRRVLDDRATGKRGRRPLAEAVTAAVGAVGHVLGRTGGPLCRPGSPFQAHAAWHTAMALVLVLRD